ncbi:hypothetical protein BO94DRAFT_291653 [Aspergillus sclerotioniger CBS 115572]|uniref:Uncharacterized protein n=1 Tax=Aspergillus sclerotioniger CBS 115572 TaxID=1450535 RepID=A0A317VD78_9EURO|nr:hypothetical protein BO94DRAFT_291653 [Aspergillus sclerotioniger CBS 115572]PWY69840.1 hypothetical protein BO94DRAFT_291653 [Aspergillus sclerotioniger CBS 115572]
MTHPPNRRLERFTGSLIALSSSTQCTSSSLITITAVPDGNSSGEMVDWPMNGWDITTLFYDFHRLSHRPKIFEGITERC